MPSMLSKAGVAALALGGFAFIGQAYALSPLPLNGGASLAIPVIDEETAIEELERPNEVPPGSQEEKGEVVAPERGAGEGGSSGDAEIEELQRAFPSTEWPPSDRKE